MSHRTKYMKLKLKFKSRFQLPYCSSSFERWLEMDLQWSWHFPKLLCSSCNNFDQVSFCACQGLNSSIKMGFIIRADKFSISFNFAHQGGVKKIVLREF